MAYPSLTTLPPPPPGRYGWPWTEEAVPPAGTRRDGQDWPCISIITPSFNQGHYLEETIRSVLLQGYPRLEYYVIDGGSADNSIEIIQKYAPWLTGWVSEPDEGQSHAIAKGFSRSSAEIIAWLNSDDCYLPGALAAVGEAWRPGDATILAGDVINFTPDGHERIIRQTGITLENMVRYWEGRYCWHQPGLFFPRLAYEKAGGMDGSLQYAMDLDLICRMLANGCTIAYLKQPVARFRLHSTSKTCAHGAAMAHETSTVSQRYWPLLDAVERAEHDAYLYGELVRLGAMALLRGQGSQGWKLWREARAASGLAASVIPVAMLRYLRRRLQRWLRSR